MTTWDRNGNPMERCYYHSRLEGIHTCRHCGKNICEGCVIRVEGEPFCQVCWEGYTIRVRMIRDLREESSAGIPWRRWRELGPIQAFVETAGQVFFKPAQFFSHVPAGKEMGPPLLFAVTCILLFWFPMNILHLKYIFPPLLDNMESRGALLSPGEGDGRPPTATPQDIRHRLLSLSNLEILTMPISYLVYYIIVASFFQQGLITLFHGREGYIATFQIRCYAMVAQCFWLIPIVGIFLAEIGSLVVCARGFQRVQKLSYSRSLFVASVPIMISFLMSPAFL